MANETNPRFAELSTNKLQDLLEIAHEHVRGNTHTNQVIEASRTLMKEYCTAKGKDFEDIANGQLEILADVLQKFYAEMRKKNGEPYCRSSYGSIRYGLQRYFQRSRNIDIVNDAEFKNANDMFKAVLVNLKKEGKGDPQHREIITDSDLRKLFNSDVFDTNDPEGLQFKVFFDVLFYTCRRSRDGLRQMLKSDFEARHDADGRRYYFYKACKKDGRRVEDVDESTRIYENPGHVICPVASLEKYLAKLNPDCEFFWQRPKIKRNIRIMERIWYDNSAIGHNLLGKMMRIISERAGLSSMYTNHSIRATYTTRLDHRGYEACQVMAQLFGEPQTELSTMYLHPAPSEWPSIKLQSPMSDSQTQDQSAVVLEEPGLSTPLMVQADTQASPHHQTAPTAVVTQRFPLVPATVVRAPSNILPAVQSPTMPTAVVGQTQKASVSTFKQVISSASSSTSPFPSVITIKQPVTSISVPSLQQQVMRVTSATAQINSIKTKQPTGQAVIPQQLIGVNSPAVVPQQLIRVTSPVGHQVGMQQSLAATSQIPCSATSQALVIKQEPEDDYKTDVTCKSSSPATCTSTTYTQTDGFWASPEDVLNLMSEIFSLKRKITELTNENENLKNFRQKTTADNSPKKDSSIQVVSAEVYNGDGSHAFTTLL